MKKITSPLFFWGAAVLSVALLTYCTSKTDPDGQKKDIVSADIPQPLCAVLPSWFPHSETPAPAEGKGSPFDVSSTTNQIFHQWSWNKFLWLTKPDKGGNPLFLNQQKVTQVNTSMKQVTPPAGTLVVLQDINQAGSKSAILQTNPDYGKSETVYYSIHMNDKMIKAGHDFAKMFPKGESNDSTFPVGCFELKVAWAPVSAIPTTKLSSYYTTMSSLSADGGKTYVNTKVALIGMHVVGIVQNHPEFIWATFEHNDLAPNYDWKSGSATASADQLLFKKGKVSGIDGVVYNTSTQLGNTPYQVFDLFQYGVPRNNDGTFMTTSQQEPLNFDNVNSINQCVQSKLDDVWKNYFYNGSIWLDTDGLDPLDQAKLINKLGITIGKVDKGTPVRGSSNCANVTMESFTQTFTSASKDINVSTFVNCFTCHKPQSFIDQKNFSPLYLSHTFQAYLTEQQGKSAATLENLKLQDEKRILLRLSK